MAWLYTTANGSQYVSLKRRYSTYTVETPLYAAAQPPSPPAPSAQDTDDDDRPGEFHGRTDIDPAKHQKGKALIAQFDTLLAEHGGKAGAEDTSDEGLAPTRSMTAPSREWMEKMAELMTTVPAQGNLPSLSDVESEADLAMLKSKTLEHEAGLREILNAHGPEILYRCCVSMLANRDAHAQRLAIELSRRQETDALQAKIDEPPVPEPSADAVREALAELVALEDMRLRLRQLHEMGHGTDYDQYHSGLSMAWAAARAALAASPKDQPPP